MAQTVRQGDLFPPPPYDENAPTPEYRPDAKGVRDNLDRILGKLSGKTKMPWKDTDERMYRCIFPQMTNWLPADEAQAYRDLFSEELVRLGCAPLAPYTHKYVEPKPDPVTA